MSQDKKLNFASAVQKGAVRAKEKFLVNLGKVDQTKDDTFDVYIANFTKQQNISNKLYKDVKAYIGAIKEKSICEKNLYDSLKNTYESEWQNKDLFSHVLDSFDFVWEDYIEKLDNQVLIPLNSYNNQFLEIKEKINKRSRKLLYFDSARHNYDTLVNSLNRKKDDLKINKALDQLKEAKKVYEDLNSELHESLPALYNSRISFLVSHFQSLFAADLHFHNEMSKINGELSELMDKLASSGINQYEWQEIRHRRSSTKDFDKEINEPESDIEKPANNEKLNESKNPFDDEIENLSDDNEMEATSYAYKVKTLFKYQAEDEDELGFDADEIIYVLDAKDIEVDPGWKLGKIKKSGKYGVFPENYTEKIDK